MKSATIYIITFLCLISTLSWSQILDINIKRKDPRIEFLNRHSSRTYHCDDLDREPYPLKNTHILTNIKNTKDCAALHGFIAYRNLDDRMDKNYYGTSAYTQIPLSDPLISGKKYRINLRMICSSEAEFDTLFLLNTGVKLSYYKFKTYDLRMIESSNILSFGEIKLNQWIEKEWIVQPLCDINYMLIGSFRNGDWPANIYYEGYRSYLIDKIKIEAVSDDSNSEWAECYESQNQDSESPFDIERTFYYLTGKFELTKYQKLLIDTLAFTLNKNNQTIIGIEGYADSQGDENIRLSAKRTEEIASYLNHNHKIPSLRIMTFSKGEEKARLELGDDRQDSSFRYTKIYISNLTPKQKILRELLKAQNKRVNSKTFDKWLLLSDLEDQVTLSLFDCYNDKLTILQKESLRKSINKKYRESNLPIYTYTIDSLILKDQKYISAGAKLRKLLGHDRNDSEDPILNCALSYNAGDSIKQNQYLSNLKSLDRIINDHGWPAIPIFGLQRSFELSLILVHTSDLNTLKKNRAFCEEVCRKGVMPWKTYALISDKIDRKEGRLQTYGTQWKRLPSNHIVIYDHINEDTLQYERSKIGLPRLDLNNKVKLTDN